jgi:hypothetical protein
MRLKFFKPEFSGEEKFVGRIDPESPEFSGRFGILYIYSLGLTREKEARD